jgi:hypothetical protein
MMIGSTADAEHGVIMEKLLQTVAALTLILGCEPDEIAPSRFIGLLTQTGAMVVIGGYDL